MNDFEDGRPYVLRVTVSTATSIVYCWAAAKSRKVWQCGTSLPRLSWNADHRITIIVVKISTVEWYASDSRFSLYHFTKTPRPKITTSIDTGIKIHQKICQWSSLQFLSKYMLMLLDVKHKNQFTTKTVYHANEILFTYTTVVLMQKAPK